jgi:dTDP-4-amino-4,6-dideoxygalactose transaminase
MIPTSPNACAAFASRKRAVICTSRWAGTCRLDAIQAAVLRVSCRTWKTWNRQRAEHASTYDRLFTQAGLFTPTADSPIRPIAVAPNAHHVYHQYVIRALRRDELRTFLAGKKIGTEIYYPIPLHLQPVFTYLGYSKGDLPEAERAAQEVLALPMFPELRHEEQQWAVENIAEFYS